MLVSLVLCGLLLLLLLQDLKTRSVNWIVFPVLTTFFILSRIWKGQKLFDILEAAGYSIFFLAVQLSCLTIYFSIKFKKVTNITNDLLGWGDIFMLLSVCFFMPFVSYLCFYVISLLLVMSFWLIYIKLLPGANQHVPLAGLHAGMLILLIGVSFVKPSFDISGDSFFLASMITYND